MEADMVEAGCWKWTTVTYVLIIGIPTIGTFSDFVDSLSNWEREFLLIHTNMSTDAYAVGVALEHGIRAVSDDGSECFKTQGSFGWIMSSDEGERLATGIMGPARGNRPNSFRSEGYANLVFLHRRLAEYSVQLHEPWKGIIATDSKSIIDTVKEGTIREQQDPTQRTPYQRPLNPLSPEWDVVVGIASATTTGNVRTEPAAYQWPPGQDHCLPPTSTPGPAQSGGGRTRQ
jgi:hypothetical protein